MENEKTKTLAVIESRVSDLRQGDGTHDTQIAESLLLAHRLGAHVEEKAIWRVTVSGSKSDRDSFKEICDYIDSKKGQVKYYICYTIERFTRAGAGTYDMMKSELRKRGVEMKDVRGTILPDMNTMENLGVEYSWSKYSPSETAELIEANGARSGKREMLTRMIGQEIINARAGYAVHPAPDGLKNETEYYFVDGKRKKLTTRKRNERTHFYEAMFNLRVEGLLTDEEIAEKVNAMGFLSKIRKKWDKKSGKQIGTMGGLPLTAKQLQNVIERASYAGVNYEEWTNWQPVRAHGQSVVSIETWNKANRGRWYIEEKQDGSLIMHQNYAPEERTKENPLYPYKDVILCSVCKKPFRGSASRSKSGKHIPAYHCERKIDGTKHKRVSGNKWVFEKDVEDFVHALSFDKEYLEAFKLVFKDKFYEKQKGATEAATSAGRQVVELQEQKQKAMQAYINASAAGDHELMSDIQTERRRIESEIQVAQSYRNTLEVTERDLDDFLFRLEWVMEHPAEFLLRAENKPQRQAYFSLMFEELPTYQDVKDGTPKMAWVFKPDSDSGIENNDARSLVRRVGFEPT